MTPGWSDALARTTERHSLGAIELFEPRRWPRNVRARQYFWMLLHDCYGWSYPEIARYMPRPYNHSTVLVGVRKARAREALANATTQNTNAAHQNETEQAREALSG